MHKIIALIVRSKQLFIDDSLFRNSVFLIASTAIMSVLGFLFWLFVAHLYSPQDIGGASALIAATTLLGNMSLLGLEYSLMRFLPGSKNQSRDINATIPVVALAAALMAMVYLVVSPHLGIHLSLVDEIWQKAGFIALMVVVGLNSLTDAVFIANRRAELHTATYSLLATVKLLLPLVLIPFGSMGIFAAYAVAVLSSFILTIALMRWKLGYRLISKPNWPLLRHVRTYAAHNYTGHFLSSLSGQIMPLIILARLGADQVAYFAIAWTMANFLYVIPTAIAQSLLAESASSPEGKQSHIRGAVKLLGLVLAPAVLITIVAAPWLLRIFGHEYAASSSAVFQILAFATFFVAINEVCNAVLNVEHRSAGVVSSQLSMVSVTLSATFALLPLGLIGAGLAFLLGTVAACVSHLVFFGLRLGTSGATIRPAPEEVILSQETKNGPI